MKRAREIRRLTWLIRIGWLLLILSLAATIIAMVLR